MPHVWQAWREAHVQVVPHTIHQKTATLPVQIMVVGDRGYAGFNDEFCQSKPQRDIEWYRQCILDQQ